MCVSVFTVSFSMPLVFQFYRRLELPNAQLYRICSFSTLVPFNLIKFSLENTIFPTKVIDCRVYLDLLK